MPTINVQPGADEHLQPIADRIAKSKRIVVVTGAGISTNCGIPDFRSENGLYSMIQEQYDAALADPPWETKTSHDIEDRPAKKRKVTERHYYQVVKKDGEVIADELDRAACLKVIADAEEEEDDDATEEEDVDATEEEVFEGKDALKCSKSGTPDVDDETSPSDQLRKESRECFDGRRSQTTPNWSRRSSTDATISAGSTPSRSTSHDTTRPNLCTDSHAASPSPRRRHDANPRAPMQTRTPLRHRHPLPPPAYSPLTNFASSPPSERSSTVPMQDPPSSPLSSPPATTPASTTPKPWHTAPAPALTLPLPHPRRRTLQRQESRLSLARSETEDSICSQSSSRSSLPNMKGKDLFDAMIWQDPCSTSIFYMFISSLRQKIRQDMNRTTVTHEFIRTLRDTGRLVRNYTQNIDCIEERVDLTTDFHLGVGSRWKSRARGKTAQQNVKEQRGVECVLLHGCLTKLRCGVCANLIDWDDDERHATTSAGLAPECPTCLKSSDARKERGRRGLAVGRLRPNIVLYGEEHPQAQLIAPLVTNDLSVKPDILLIMGTSLRVHGLKVMIREFAKAVHTKGGKVIFVNQTKPAESTWGDVIDYHVEWDCDEWVHDLKRRRNDIWDEPDCDQNVIAMSLRILDTLRSVKDATGKHAQRKIFYPRRPRTRLKTRPKTLLVTDLPESLRTTHPAVEIPWTAPAKSKPVLVTIRPGAPNTKPAKSTRRGKPAASKSRPAAKKERKQPNTLVKHGRSRKPGVNRAEESQGIKSYDGMYDRPSSTSCPTTSTPFRARAFEAFSYHETIRGFHQHSRSAQAHSSGNSVLSPVEHSVTNRSPVSATMHGLPSPSLTSHPPSGFNMPTPKSSSPPEQRRHRRSGGRSCFEEKENAVVSVVMTGEAVSVATRMSISSVLSVGRQA